jgi:hypothetical protein
MSEHDDRSASTDLPRTTGEFRAAPDVSASTAEFKRFMGQDAKPERRGGASEWPEQPWSGSKPQRTVPNRNVLYLVGALVVVVLIVIIIVTVG